MSQENVEMVRAAFEAFTRRDMDGALKHATSDFTVDLSRAVGLDRGVYDADAWRRMTDEFSNTWESVEWTLDEFIDAGARVVTPFTNQLRGRDGIEIEAHGFWVWTIRDRAIAMLSYYDAREHAIEAAGLSEQAMSQEHVEMIRRQLHEFWRLARNDRGADEVKRAWTMVTEAWESVRIDVSEFIEGDGGTAVTRQKARFVGRNGIELPGPTRSG